MKSDGDGGYCTLYRMIREGPHWRSDIWTKN